MFGMPEHLAKDNNPLLKFSLIVTWMRKRGKYLGKGILKSWSISLGSAGTLKGCVRLNEMRSEGCLPSRVTGCLEIVCQIVFMVRQVHAVALELPAWNYIGNGKRRSKRIIKGQLRLQGREEKRQIQKEW